MKTKILATFLAVMFLCFALVQVNDPDPLLWILVYGSMMVISIMALFNRFPIQIMIVMAGGYLLLSALHVDGMMEWLESPNRSLLFSDIAKMQYPYIEEAREFLGLLICLLVLLFYFYLHRKTTRAR